MENFDWLMGFVLPYFNFALFVAMFIYFFRKPLSNFARGRREEYERFFEEAKKARAEAEAETARLEGRLKNLDQEIQSMKQGTLSAAEQEAAAIVADAKRRAETIVAEADRLVEATLERARLGLRQEIMGQVEKQLISGLQSELDGPKQKQINQQGVAKLAGLNMGGLR